MLLPSTPYTFCMAKWTCLVPCWTKCCCLLHHTLFAWPNGHVWYLAGPNAAAFYTIHFLHGQMDMSGTLLDQMLLPSTPYTFCMAKWTCLVPCWTKCCCLLHHTLFAWPNGHVWYLAGPNAAAFYTIHFLHGQMDMSGTLLDQMLLPSTPYMSGTLLDQLFAWPNECLL